MERKLYHQIEINKIIMNMSNKFASIMHKKNKNSQKANKLQNNGWKSKHDQMMMD